MRRAVGALIRTDLRLALRSRESVPALIAAAGAGQHLLAAGGPSYEQYGTWLGVLGLYDLIFLLIGWAAFDFLIED